MRAGSKRKHFEWLMPGERTYLDHNATSPLRPAVRARVVEVLDAGANPSSVHAEGRRARAVVEAARGAVAALVGALPEGVVFTSGATEAAALALAPGLSDGPGQLPATRLLVGSTEHPAVLAGHRFAADRVGLLPVLANGTVDLDALNDLLRQGSGRTIVALQAANGETGVLQPVAEAARLVHARGDLLVCDCAQAAGRIDCRFDALGADVLLLSAHKLGGPQGAGAAVLRSDALRFGLPLMRGGGQERGLRGGTENVAAIAGFAVAATEAASLADVTRLTGLRDRVETGIRALAPDAVVFGADAPRLPNTTAFAVPGLPNDAALIALDLAGVAVATGSACSSGRVSRSHVLEVMGVDPHLSSGLIRVSVGWPSTSADVDRFLSAFDAVLRRKRSRALRAAA